MASGIICSRFEFLSRVNVQVIHRRLPLRAPICMRCYRQDQSSRSGCFRCWRDRSPANPTSWLGYKTQDCPVKAWRRRGRGLPPAGRTVAPGGISPLFGHPDGPHSGLGSVHSIALFYLRGVLFPMTPVEQVRQIASRAHLQTIRKPGHRHRRFLA